MLHHDSHRLWLAGATTVATCSRRLGQGKVVPVVTSWACTAACLTTGVPRLALETEQSHAAAVRIWKSTQPDTVGFCLFVCFLSVCFLCLFCFVLFVVVVVVISVDVHCHLLKTNKQKNSNNNTMMK